MRAHLKIVNTRDETVIDEDVNDVAIDHAWVTWRTWEKGAKMAADEHTHRLRDVTRIEMSQCSDRLAKAADADDVVHEFSS